MGPRSRGPGPRLLSPGKHSCDPGPSILGPGSQVPDCYNYAFRDPNKDHKKRLCYVGVGPRLYCYVIVLGFLVGTRTIMVPQCIVAFYCNRPFLDPDKTLGSRKEQLHQGVQLYFTGPWIYCYVLGFLVGSHTIMVPQCIVAPPGATILSGTLIKL